MKFFRIFYISCIRENSKEETIASDWWLVNLFFYCQKHWQKGGILCHRWTKKSQTDPERLLGGVYKRSKAGGKAKKMCASFQIPYEPFWWPAGEADSLWEKRVCLNVYWKPGKNSGRPCKTHVGLRVRTRISCGLGRDPGMGRRPQKRRGYSRASKGDSDPYVPGRLHTSGRGIFLPAVQRGAVRNWLRLDKERLYPHTEVSVPVLRNRDFRLKKKQKAWPQSMTMGRLFAC